MNLRIVFAGTPHFAIPSLSALMTHYEVCAIYTKPDSPSGRGQKLVQSPVKQYAKEHYPLVPIFQPSNLKNIDVLQQLNELNADIMVVIAYGYLIPKSLYSLFRYGCINVHASLLPRWRGAAPIQRALLAGDRETGVTIMQIDEGLDTGAMWQQTPYQIEPGATAGSLHESLSILGAKSLIGALDNIIRNQTKPNPQNSDLATYAAKIDKKEAHINWLEDVSYIDRQVRAFNPWPVAYSHLNGVLLKVWQGCILSTEEHAYPPGLIVSADETGIDVAAKKGLFRITQLQLAGGKPLSVKEFLNSRKELFSSQAYLGSTHSAC